jgi:hypothetical protein
VVIWLDENRFKQMLAGVPKAMLTRRINEMEQNAEDYGIKTLTSGDGFIRVDITGARRDYVLTWLAAHAACCDVEPGDVETLMGRNLDALVVMRGLQSGAKLSSVTPDELIDALETLAVRLQTTHATDYFEPGLQDAIREQAEDDLVNAGLIPAGKGLGESLEPRTSPEPHISFEFRDAPEVDFLDPFSPANRQGFGW